MIRDSSFPSGVKQLAGIVAASWMISAMILICAGPALFLASCSTQETTKVEREVRPVILDNGALVRSAAKVATSDPLSVVVFGSDGLPVPGDQPTEINANGMVVVPPGRLKELQNAERALGAAMVLVDGITDREAAVAIEDAVAEELGR